MFQIIRSGVLLSVLIFLPVIAVCWNMIPKNMSSQKEEIVAAAPNNHVNLTNPIFNEQHNSIQTPVTEKNIKDNDPESVWLESSIPLSADPLMNSSLPDGSITDKNRVAGTAGILPDYHNLRNLNPPSNSSSNPPSNPQLNQPTSNSDLVHFMPMTPLPSLSNSPVVVAGGKEVAGTGGKRDFSEIVKELQQLGATYYCLEKWGDQGELFRFRCYVNLPNMPLENKSNQPNNYRYQKFFQHIGNDQINVMEHVIGEIKKWKNSQSY
ncbi:MAG: hypothetical protein LBC74_05280 [Planctomycetaceae bacterium]|jgi:hypothetical protein|nr:hypothetical protein [Planctomycetaceae bacterium]